MTDTSKYDISIIIPVYGVEDYIEECLRSVMAQKAVDKISVECIVVDDCGPDKSIDIAERIIDSYNGPIDFKIIRRKKTEASPRLAIQVFTKPPENIYTSLTPMTIYRPIASAGFGNSPKNIPKLKLYTEKRCACPILKKNAHTLT